MADKGRGAHRDRLLIMLQAMGKRQRSVHPGKSGDPEDEGQMNTPAIESNIAQPWPVQAEERLVALERLVGELSIMHAESLTTSPHPEIHGEWMSWNVNGISNLFVQIADLRQQVRDMQETQQALIVAMLKTDDGDDEDND